MLSSLLVFVFATTTSHAVDACKCQVYTGCNYTGASRCINSNTRTVGPTWSGKISSIKVQKGSICTIYEKDDWGGSNWSFIANYNCLKYGPSGMNDKTSSVRVKDYDTSCKCLLFVHCGWLGASRCYNSNASHVGSEWDDKFSSIIVGANTRCKLWENQHYKGKSYTLTNSSDACFTDEGRNDIVTSIQVSDNTGTPNRETAKVTMVTAGGFAGVIFAAFGAVFYNIVKKRKMQQMQEIQYENLDILITNEENI